MQVICPCCQSEFPIEAGWLDGDAKRLAMLLARAEPALGRAVVGYLRLHRPAKQSLRLTRAAKLAEEVLALASAGEVCRGGLCRPCTSATWVAAIEQMLDGRAKLRLPLSGHGYLTEVAYSLADQADAIAERQREQHLREGRRPAAPVPTVTTETPLQRDLAWIDQQLGYGAITAEQAQQQRAAARAKHGAPA